MSFTGRLVVQCFQQKDALSQEAAVKLSSKISWAIRTLQRILFSRLEESGGTALTENAKRPISILELSHSAVLHSNHNYSPF
jgi:hypothetical protein